MRAVVLDETGGDLRFAADHPEPEGSGELLDVTACGVCHSDIHVVDGTFGKTPPIVLGHEVTGVHDRLGPVMMYAPWGCRSADCEQCGHGNEMICPDSSEAGLFTDGGYAERVRVPDISYLAPLDGLDPFRAAPLACGGLTAYRAVHHGLERLHERGGDATALVIGAGGLGQYALSYLRLLSDAHVTVLDLSADKQRAALDIGAHDATGDASALATYDLVIDFIGAASTLEAAAASVKRLGTVAVVGLGGGSIPFGFGLVPLEAKLVASVWGSRSEMDDLLALARREPSIVRDVEVMPLEDAQLAHERLRAGDVETRVVLDVAGTAG